MQRKINNFKLVNYAKFLESECNKVYNENEKMGNY